MQLGEILQYFTLMDFGTSIALQDILNPHYKMFSLAILVTRYNKILARIVLPTLNDNHQRISSKRY